MYDPFDWYEPGARETSPTPWRIWLLAGAAALLVLLLGIGVPLGLVWWAFLS